jgi:dolichol-phosphate mannosyltransferase
MVRKVMTLKEKEFNLLIVDDGSPDGTGAIVKTLMQEFPDRLFLEERKGKLGLGTAYIHGFKWSLARKYDYIFEMDCDFSHDPDDLPRLYKACTKDGADLAIGSRYINGVTVINWPIGRVIMSYYASAYVRFVTGMTIRDTTAGFVCFKRIVLETLNLDKITFMGYAFQIEMKFTAWKHGFNLLEIPIIFKDRTEGVSKMSSKIFKEAFIGVLQMRIKSMFHTFKKVSSDK